MTISITLMPGEDMRLKAHVLAQIEGVRQQVQQKMSETYYSVVMDNMGKEAWANKPLSAAYARRVGRQLATLYVSGELKGSVALDPEGANVSISNGAVPYATVHQFGGGNNIPSRPYFPLEGADSPIGYEATVNVVTQAAGEEIRRLLT